MKHLAIAAALAMAPLVTHAQDIVYDFSHTEGCIAASTGFIEKFYCIGVSAEACMGDTEGGYSTAGSRNCFEAEMKDWDRRLNSAYGALKLQFEALETLDSETDDYGRSRAVALQDMQRAWIAYRDARCDFIASRWTGGTAGGPIRMSCLAHRTGRQALLLESEIDTN